MLSSHSSFVHLVFFPLSLCLARWFCQTDRWVEKQRLTYLWVVISKAFCVFCNNCIISTLHHLQDRQTQPGMLKYKATVHVGHHHQDPVGLSASSVTTTSPPKNRQLWNYCNCGSLARFCFSVYIFSNNCNASGRQADRRWTRARWHGQTDRQTGRATIPVGHHQQGLAGLFVSWVAAASPHYSLDWTATPRKGKMITESGTVWRPAVKCHTTLLQLTFSARYNQVHKV